MYDKIKKIINEKHLNTSEFLNITKISRTTFYALKKGETDKLNAKSIRKIIHAFPEYSYEWMTETEQKRTDVVKSELSIKKIALFVTENEDELLEDPLFNFWLNNKIKDGVIEFLKKHE